MRSEKGSITVYVLIAMLTFTAFLMAIYVRNSNKEMAQIEIIEKIKAIYENYDKDEVYATITDAIPEILGYERGAKEITIKTLVENGLNVDQNGKEIIYYAATVDNVAPTESSDEIGTFGKWQKSKDISLVGYEETEIYVWIKNEDGNISKPLDTTIKKSEAAFLETKEGKILNYKIYGNSKQNGTPAPETPIEIESVGDKTKNLFNKDKGRTAIKGNVQDNTYTVNDNTISFQTNYYSINDNLFGVEVDVNPNTNYRLSFSTVEGRSYTTIYSSTGSILKYNNDYYGISFNSENNTKIYIHFRSNVWGLYTKLENVQLEEGTETTDYEPYGKYRIPIKVNDEITNIYLDEPLRKISKEGDYSDYIDFSNKIVHREIVELNLNGSENWILNSGSNSNGRIMSIKLPHNRAYTMDMYCSRAPVSGNSVANPYGSGFRLFHGGGAGYLYFFVPYTIAETIAEFKEWLSNNNTQVIYAVTTAGIKTQTIDLPTIQTHKGTTKIEVDTTIAPSKIEISY